MSKQFIYRSEAGLYRFGPSYWHCVPVGRDRATDIRSKMLTTLSPLTSAFGLKPASPDRFPNDARMIAMSVQLITPSPSRSPSRLLTPTCDVSELKVNK